MPLSPVSWARTLKCSSSSCVLGMWRAEWKGNEPVGEVSRRLDGRGAHCCSACSFPSPSAALLGGPATAVADAYLGQRARPLCCRLGIRSPWDSGTISARALWLRFGCFLSQTVPVCLFFTLKSAPARCRYLANRSKRHTLAMTSPTAEIAPDLQRQLGQQPFRSRAWPAHLVPEQHR